MSSSRLTSQRTASPPLSFATGCSPSALRSATTTPAAPSRAKRSAAARPMPLAAPVTTATLPFRSTAPPSAALLRRERLGDRGLLAQLHLGDRVAVHLVGPVGEAQRARVRV